MKVGDTVLVYGQWSGIIKGEHSNKQWICQYTKHGRNIIGFVDKSRVKLKGSRNERSN